MIKTDEVLQEQLEQKRANRKTQKLQVVFEISMKHKPNQDTLKSLQPFLLFCSKSHNKVLSDFSFVHCDTNLKSRLACMYFITLDAAGSNLLLSRIHPRLMNIAPSRGSACSNPRWRTATKAITKIIMQTLSVGLLC